MKKIFCIYCNPKSENSLTYKLINAYMEGAKKSNNEIKLLNVYDLDIDFLNYKSYEEITINEKFKKIQEDITWADKIVIAYPVWYGSIPAKLKSFCEQVFSVGFALEFSPDKLKPPKPLLKGKEAIIIQSYSMPYIMMKFFSGDIAFKSLSLGILKTCGIKTKKRFDVDLTATLNDKKLNKLLLKIQNYASKH